MKYFVLLIAMCIVLTLSALYLVSSLGSDAIRDFKLGYVGSSIFPSGTVPKPIGVVGWCDGPG